jgi:uncharacterized protein (DUF1015 family)
MAIIKPFRGITYNPEKVNPDNIMAPPYDIISEEERANLYQKSIYNIVRIDCAENKPGQDKYLIARQNLETWLKEKIFMREEKPIFYGYEIIYRYKNYEKILRGIIGVIKLEELGQGVYPHEQTYSKPKTDRLNLMKACMANTSLIFSIYRSKERITSKIVESLTEPFIKAKDSEGNIHNLYRIEDAEKINEIIEEFRDKSIFIADGHHRYEVALEFKKQMDKLYPEAKDPPWHYVMMFFSNIEDNGYIILPTHRLINTSSSVKKQFEEDKEKFILQEFDDKDDIQNAIENMGTGTFGLYLKDDKWYILKYKGSFMSNLPEQLRFLDVTILEEIILKKIFPQREVFYEIEIDKAVKMVKEGKFDAIFALRATNVEDIEKVALAGLRMPPKSTYFYPKLLTGMVINSFKENF